MRYFIDTEFLEGERSIELLSLGIVAEDGRGAYFQSIECDRSTANDWVKANVLPHLEHIGCGRDEGKTSMCYQNPIEPDRTLASCPWRSRSAIAAELIQFCDPERYGKPELWGYFADYDWVVLCQLFGRMVDLPKGWPMYCRDLKQWADELGNPELPPEGKNEHHALADARWNKGAWAFLLELQLARSYIAEEVESPAAHATSQLLTDRDDLLDLAETSWGLIANAGWGNWHGESAAWQAAAPRWRERYHAIIARHRSAGAELRPEQTVIVTPPPPSWWQRVRHSLIAALDR